MTQDSVEAELLQAPSGARGIVSSEWQSRDAAGRFGEMTGHYVNVIQVEGQIYYIDAEVNTLYTPADVRSHYPISSFVRTN